MGKLKEQLFSRWVACGVVSDKKSVRYGLYFSYPIYILIVLAGILLKNPYVLALAAVIAFCGIKLPLHPFDYLYNYGVAKVIGTNTIPARGSELQVNSAIAVVFNLVVIALITLGISIHFGVLAMMYALSSIFFIGYFLSKD